MKNFVTTADFSYTELNALVEEAFHLKSGVDRNRPLTGRSVALVLFDPSLRTRASMQVAIHELGGNPVVVEPGTTSWTIEHREGVVMDSDKTEHLKEFVRVLERYVSAIGVRCFAEMKNWKTERDDPILKAIANFANVPVINLESAMHHPCQAMADMMTIREKLGVGRKKVLLSWAWHPKPLPMAVPNSFALAAAQFGHDLCIAHPHGYELDDEIINSIGRQAKQSGGRVEFSNNINEAFEGVDAVYAKSWGAAQFYGSAETDMAFRADLRDGWIVDADKMAKTNDAIFMHCLPVRRNVVVTDDVIDSPRSVVIDEAENRLHIQKAILSGIFK